VGVEHSKEVKSRNQCRWDEKNVTWLGVFL